MSEVFLDTVGLLALWDISDQWHIAANEAFVRLSSAQETLTTSSFILLECGNAAARRPYRDAVDRLREKLEATGALIHPQTEDWLEAWSAYRKGKAANAGIVDHVSFTVMRRLGITRAFTNDAHFRVTGFETLF